MSLRAHHVRVGTEPIRDLEGQRRAPHLPPEHQLVLARVDIECRRAGLEQHSAEVDGVPTHGQPIPEDRVALGDQLHRLVLTGSGPVAQVVQHPGTHHRRTPCIEPVLVQPGADDDGLTRCGLRRGSDRGLGRFRVRRLTFPFGLGDYRIDRRWQGGFPLHRPLYARDRRGVDPDGGAVRRRRRRRRHRGKEDVGEHHESDHERDRQKETPLHQASTPAARATSESLLVPPRD